MHLLKYAQKKELDLDCEEYLNMFRTSTSRISMCSFLPTNIDTVDSSIFKRISSECSKQAKLFFSYGEISRNHTQNVVKTHKQI